MNLPRRTFLKGVIATSGAMALGTAVLPPTVMADWPKMAFEAKTVEDALMALFESPDVKETDKIIIKAPSIAENGAVVPIEVTADLPNVESITIIGEKNPIPLIGQFNFTESVEPWVKTRIKMGETSNVVAVVIANGVLFVMRREVKVTIGGCGG